MVPRQRSRRLFLLNGTRGRYNRPLRWRVQTTLRGPSLTRKSSRSVPTGPRRPRFPTLSLRFSVYTNLLSPGRRSLDLPFLLSETDPCHRLTVSEKNLESLSNKFLKRELKVRSFIVVLVLG